MSESDLREVLEDQGASGAGLVDIRALDAGAEELQQAIVRERGGVEGPIVFDGIRDDHCALVAEAIWRVGEAEPVVVLSAQGFAHGFGRFWNRTAAVAHPPVEALPAVNRLLVVSGSAAPLTARQIDAFAQSGATVVRLRASDCLDPAAAERALAATLQAASEVLAAGRSACVFTALGPNDEDTPALRRLATAMALDHGEVSRRIGGALAKLALGLVERHGLRRVVIAGGDTSSYALKSMAPEGLAVASGDYATGAHVFRLSGAAPIEGLELTFKGGQIGDEGFFVRLRDGRAANR